MQSPRVCISVLNWNNHPTTTRCLQALQNSTYTNYEILLVDNASQDNSVEQLRRQFPHIRIIRSPENLGFAGGNELALQVALDNGRFECFWILNNDAMVLPNTLSELIAAYQQHGKAALYGGIPVHEINGAYHVHMRVWENRKYRMLREVPIHDYFETLDPRPAEALSGSHLLIPLDVVRQYGFIDTSFFLYSEDADYCFRLREQGIACIKVPSSMVIHYGGTSHKAVDGNRLAPVIRYYRARNRIVLFRRHFGFTDYSKEVARQLFYSVAWLLKFFKLGPIALRCGYYSMLGVRDGIRNRMGKTYAPDDFMMHVFENRT